jgi:hypothetical protein
MQLKRNGLTIHADDALAERLLLAHLNATEIPPTFEAVVGDLPRIGAEVVEWGGVFAGVVRGAEGSPDYCLIVGPEAPSKMQWQSAVDWATAVTHLGFADFVLFNRPEQSICYANVPELFQKEWYWSSEQLAEFSDAAWYHDFGYGSQDGWLKGDSYRARAVRRVVIQ